MTKPPPVDGVEIEQEDAPSPEDVAALVNGLVAWNASRVEREHREPVAAFARRGGSVVGGADGSTQWQWLYVSHLWVADELRGLGLGRRIMEAIEATGRRRGCGAAWLDTFSFQARPFYERLGYRCFGELEDFPPGHTRHFMWKPLA